MEILGRGKESPEQPKGIWFQVERGSLKSKPHGSTVTRLRDHLLLLLLTVRLLIAALAKRKFPGGLLGCIRPGLHGALLAQNCLQREAGREITTHLYQSPHPPPQLVI